MIIELETRGPTILLHVSESFAWDDLMSNMRLDLNLGKLYANEAVKIINMYVMYFKYAVCQVAIFIMAHTS